MAKNYELIEHTADICFRVKAQTLPELFQNAASAVFDLLAEEKPSGKAHQLLFTVIESGGDREELMVNWLNELLSRSAAENVIFTAFKVKEFKDTSLKAEVMGKSAEGFRRKTEIKAATYHQLKIDESQHGFSVQVVLDV